MVGTRRPKFVLFGSSIVQFSFIYQGWGAILADLYSRRADIILRGYAGWNSTRALQVMQEVFPLDAVEQPSLVIVYYGGNDSKGPTQPGFHVPLPQYVTNMEHIIAHLKGLSESTHLLFLGTPPVNVKQIVENSGDDQGYTNENCGRYSAALLELCRRKNVEVVDLWTAIQQHPNWEDVCFTDGIHFTYEGSKIVVREILKVLKQIDWSPSLFWKSMPVEYSDVVVVPKWQQEWDF
ncbi:hypothetical protein Leryth_018809 [Lithospermum erythrorhizon]|nr:hypothetical protein Leryth_018809 [Lithospermum erythrorhizon]